MRGPGCFIRVVDQLKENLPAGAKALPYFGSFCGTTEVAP
jgi:hypothetical protein